MKELPNTLHELLHVAMTDLSKCESSGKYVIDMSEWHSPTGSGWCRVCMAGAVMACSLGIPDEKFASPLHVGEIGLANKLRAINDLRQGFVVCAVDSIYGPNASNDLKLKAKRASNHFLHVNGGHPAPYDSDPLKFKQQMSLLYTILELAGI